MAEITNAIAQNSIVPIAEALAQKIGFSLPGNDTGPFKVNQKWPFSGLK